jgi:hypothetical protein
MAPDHGGSRAAGVVRRRVRSRVRARERSGSHAVIKLQGKAYRRAKLTLVTALAVALAVGASWWMAGRFIGDASRPGAPAVLE